MSFHFLINQTNEMAVLFQLGVQFVQGYFVQEPQEVILTGGALQQPIAATGTGR
jgi:EAL domain-containing protein (putative c-di-GMP-specific phosphodiesterase class I)